MSHTQRPKNPLRNRILLHLPEHDRDALLSGAHRTRMLVGHTLARAGDPMAFAYFPDGGVISLVREMTTGHQVGVGTVGPEGVVGVECLFGAGHYPCRVTVMAESVGYRVATDRLLRTFEASEPLRRVILAHVGQHTSQLIVTAACNRIHSHRERLARWLLEATDKAEQQSLRVTHDMLAQLVGGPRHAVTLALNALRNKGAVAHLRGQLDIVKRPLLIQQACECYRLYEGLTRSKSPRV